EWTERALQQALAADDRELVAYVYIRMGQLAGSDGERVIGLARAAQREYGLSAGVRGLALREEARGHALTGAADPCLTRLDEAAEVTGAATGHDGDEYRVGYYLTAHHLTVERASCLLELGLAGEAIEAYRQNSASRAALCQWEQGLHLAKLARAHAQSGESEQA